MKPFPKLFFIKNALMTWLYQFISEVWPHRLTQALIGNFFGYREISISMTEVVEHRL